MKFSKALIITLAMAAALVSCQNQTPPSDPVEQQKREVIDIHEVVKSQSDQRDYRYLLLDNGLKILLISDPDSDKSAAAMDVSAGAFHAPEDRAGLLHFLEHMLFLGTKKYPTAGEYSEYLKKNGGSSNAYTSTEDTNYFFDVKNEAFDEALDRFAQFFIAPTMESTYVDREKNAVDSEYSVKIKQDDRRIREAQRQAINPAHPYRIFSVGNLDTLADRDDDKVYDALMSAYKQHYSAHRMGLVVMNNEPLDIIEKSVREKFSAIINNGIEKPKLNSQFFTENQHGTRVNIVPLRDMRKLDLTFEIEDTQQYALQKPTRLITHLLGHEGENSLYDNLNKQGLVESLSANVNNDEALDTLSIEIELTEKGYVEMDAVIEQVFIYIDLVKKKGITADNYAELKNIANLNFTFQEQVSPMSTVNSLAPKLHNTAPANLLNNRYIYNGFNPDLSRQYLSQLKPSLMQLTVVAPGLTTDSNEPLYDVNYSIKKIPAEKIARWSNAKASAEMMLPALNPFVADDISMNTAVIDSKPELIINKEGLKLWHYQDTSFNVPKSTVYVRIESPFAGNNVENRAMLALSRKLIEDKLNAYGYNAKLAGLSYSLFESEKGLGYSVNGYSDKQVTLIDAINKTIIDFDIEQPKFDLLKASLLRDWKNALLARPIGQVYERAIREFGRDAFSSVMLTKALQSVTFNQLSDYMKTMLSEVSIKLFAHGNTSQEQAIELANNIRDHYFESAKVGPEFTSNLRQLMAGDEVINELNIDHDDSAIVIVYPLEITMAGLQQSQMIGQVLNAAFFNDLRTTQQLGYIVGARGTEFENLPVVGFYIQSSKVGPKELERRIDQFIKDQFTVISDMTDAEFAKHKAGLLSNINRKDKNLLGRTNRLWAELSDGFDNFDKREQLTKSINEMTKKQLVSAYQAVFMSQQRRRLISRNFGKAHQDNADFTTALKDTSICRDEQCWK